MSNPPKPTVVPFPTVKRTKTSLKAEAKWGKEVWELGFNSIPSILFRAQGRLGLTCTQMCVLLQLADFWWDAQRKPFPSKAELATRLNLGERQVQRIMAELEKGGFVTRVEQRLPRRGKTTNQYDLTGLTKKLAKLAPEFRQQREDAKARRRELEKPLRRRGMTTA